MRKLILLFVLAALAALLAACVMPVAEEMAEGDMAGGEMAMDESMAEMPEMVEGELTVANVRANLTLPTDTGSVWLVIMNGTDTDDALDRRGDPGLWRRRAARHEDGRGRDGDAPGGGRTDSDPRG